LLCDFYGWDRLEFHHHHFSQRGFCRLHNVCHISGTNGSRGVQVSELLLAISKSSSDFSSCIADSVNEQRCSSPECGELEASSVFKLRALNLRLEPQGECPTDNEVNRRLLTCLVVLRLEKKNKRVQWLQFGVPHAIPQRLGLMVPNSTLHRRTIFTLLCVDRTVTTAHST
jgi:hypothetical protein